MPKTITISIGDDSASEEMGEMMADSKAKVKGTKKPTSRKARQMALASAFAIKEQSHKNK